MLFRHPKLLYALFALLIPIIIHLFKLRKFKKVAFTNVALLEKVKLQSRKSAQLKKWLVLLSRIGLLACAIIAFAKPYLPASSKEDKPDHYIIYLDNSYSMQAQGNKGELLQRAIQNLVSVLQDEEEFSLFTNTETWENTNLTNIQNELLQIDYTNEQLSADQVILKAKQLGKPFKNSALISISDFQDKQFNYETLLKNSKGIIQLKALEQNNIAIDSVWINPKKKEELLIKVTNNGSQKETTLSIFNDDELLGRSTVNFDSKTVIKTLSLAKKKTIKGRVSIIDKGLTYDDTYYFSINPSSLSVVISIGNVNQSFLSKIYTNDQFQFSTMLPSALNFAELSKANTIILNEVTEMGKSLENLLIQFLNNDGNLIVIPSKNTSTTFLNSLNTISNITLGKLEKEKKRITNINFNHPSYKGVFTKRIENFQYPETKTSRTINPTAVLLSYEDNQAFLATKGNTYIFTTSLQLENCNFLNSPLVVPTFFKLGLKDSDNKSISYTIGSPNQYALPISLAKDQVIQLSGKTESVIPLQQTYTEYVKINTNELPKKAGNYNITDTKHRIINNYNVSYNYNTSESNLTYITIPESAKVFESVDAYFSKEKAGFETTDLWKWFIIFALIFMAIEILLLKFLK